MAESLRRNLMPPRTSSMASATIYESIVLSVMGRSEEALMALINCPDCGSEVSDRAAMCPKCACPIAKGSPTLTAEGPVQLIEQSAKKYKLRQLSAGLLMIFGFILIIFNFFSGLNGVSDIGLLLFVAGLIWYIVARVATWWHHG